MNRTIKALIVGVVASMLSTALLHYGATWVDAGTVIASTTVYNGSDEASFNSSALPANGAYIFSLVATSTPTSASTFSGLSVYLQQVGISGQVYTLNSSTFTTCNAACVQLVNPDVYEGGNIKTRWTVTTGSVTIKVTATPVTP